MQDTDKPLAPSLMALDEIAEREESTRRLSKKHVGALVESIAAVGLIQPIAVDSQGVLLAGGHRLAALKQLQQERAEFFSEMFPEGLVPVRIIALESGEAGARKALEIEMSENEKRRDYTGGEIAALVGRLKHAGYSSAAGGPRRKGDKKHLTDALATVLGKSRRQAQRLISANTQATKPSLKESAIARCMRAAEQALTAAAADGTLESVAEMLEASIQKKVRSLAERGSQIQAA